MAWSNVRAKPGIRGRRILEDDYDDEEEEGAISDQPEDDDEDEDEAEYDDDEDPDGDADGDGDVPMDSPDDGGDDDDGAGEDDDEDYDEEDEDADGEADDDGDGDSDDDGDGDDDDDDGDGEDDDIDADGDGEEVDAEADGDGDDDDDDDDDDEDADGDPDDAATPATTKAGTPAPARSEFSLATPSKSGPGRFQRGPTSSVADDTPSRPRGHRRLDDDYDDEDEDDEDEDAGTRAQLPSLPPKPVRYSKYAPETYTERTKARLDAIRPSDEVFQTNAYSIEPSAAAPHVAHVHAFSMSADSTVLLTGGSDGYVRSYDLYQTMNGRQMLTQSVRHAYVEGVVRAGVMKHFWGNDEVPRKMNPALIKEELPVSAVHSLACQRDALWGLSGTESGNINLFTIRHASGRIQHVLRKHKAPVSVMALADDDRTLISGSWDRNVHQWDLDSGKVVRSYPGHAGQVSSLSFRPIQNGSRHKRRRTSPRAEDEDAGDSSTLLDDPNTQISISIRTPKALNEQDSKLEEMDVENPSPLTAVKPAENDSDEEGKTSVPDRTVEPIHVQSDPQPPPPPAPPDDKEHKDDQQSTISSGLGLSLHVADEDKSKAELAKNGDLSKAGAQPAADEDNDSLFGGSDEEAAAEIASSAKPGADGPTVGNATVPKPSDGPEAGADTGDADGEADADADGDADGDDDRDGDADADDDDQPLFAIALRERAAGVGTPSLTSISLPAGSALARTQSSSTLNNSNSPAFVAGGGAGLLMPVNGSSAAAVSSPVGLGVGGTTPALPSSQPLPTVSAAVPDLAAPQPPPKPRTQTSHLPKPAFGPATAVRGFSDDVSTFSDDILLSTTLAGQVMLWDRRVKSNSGPVGTLANGRSHIDSNNMLGISGPHAHLNGAPNGSRGLQRTLSGLSGHYGYEAPTLSSSSSSSNPYEQGRGVRALALPEKTPPWCAAACWSAFGDRIYVGRRNETVDEWDLRMVGSKGDADNSKHNPRFVRSLKLPMGSGSVSALCAMPNGRHIVCGSFDNVRLWDTEAAEGTMPFRIVAGHHGGFVSQMGVDATARFLLVASGDRGWLSTSTEALLIHEIQAQ